MIPKQPIKAQNADGTQSTDVTTILVPDDSISGGVVDLSTSGGGGVTGPVSSTDNAVARWNSTGGDAIQNSTVVIADTTGNISGTQKITVGVTGSATGSIELKGTTSGTVTVKTADAAGTWTMTLPTDDGTPSQFLQTDGSGVTSWATGSGGIGGSTGSTDNAVLRADGTGGATAQSSNVTIDDSGFITSGGASAIRKFVVRDLNGNNFAALYGGNEVVADTNYALASNGADTRLNSAGGGGGVVRIAIANTDKLKIDETATAGQTALLLWDVDNATLERVTVGAADSGGAGFKVLRIPN